MSIITNSNNIERRVTDKAVDYIYKNMPTTVISQLVIPVLVLVVVWSYADHLTLVIWTIVGLLIGLIRYLLYLSYTKNRSLIVEPSKWGNYYSLTSFAVGITNGSAVILFYVPESVGIAAFLTLIVGYTAGAIIVNAYWLSSSYSLAIPLLGLSAIGHTLEGHTESIVTGILLTVYLFLALKFARNMNTAVLETIRLQIENLDLSSQFKEQKEMADEANIAKSKFLAAASHDLRQPLHAMGLFSNVLENKLTTDEQKLLFGKVSNSFDALNELLNTLLDVSKLDAGVVDKNCEHFDLDKLLQRLATEFSTEAKQKELLLIYEKTEVVAYSDPVLLELILRNLISNAIRYTSNGKVSIEVSKDDSTNLKIDIRDTGMGIPENKQKDIFKEFHQLGNPERDRSKGLGLGLAIVKRLTALLQHSLTVQSEINKGSVFSLLVPAGIETEIIQSTVEEKFRETVSVQDIAIILIDDDIQIREGMQRSLEEWGCKVLIAASEEEALQKIKLTNFVPKAIISDYRLRENKTGVQAIDAIRKEIASEIPALIITGDTAPERLNEAKASGHTLLHKPVQPAQILAFIRRTVKNN